MDSLHYLNKLVRENLVRLAVLLEPMSNISQLVVINRLFHLDKSAKFGFYGGTRLVLTSLNMRSS